MPRILKTDYNGVETVYLDGRLILQTKSGVVTAFQAYNSSVARLIKTFLPENYSIIPGKVALLVHYGDEITVKTSEEVLNGREVTTK